jgi:hypothetical protein
MVWDILSWLLFIVFIAGLIVVGGLLLKGYLTQGGNASAFAGSLFGPKPEKRLEVVDQANVDGRRRLLLLRRDNVEHLIMTGGPVDVVIETGIDSGVRANPAPLGRVESGPAKVVEPLDKASNVIGRPVRSFGKTANES